MPVTVCDKNGIILEMNAESCRQFKEDGGSELIGKSLLDCHPEPARAMVIQMLQSQTPHTFLSKNGSGSTLVHEIPWYEDGKYMGFVEISIKLPSTIQCTSGE